MSWHSWFNVSGGMAELGSPITVVARNPDHLDLFVVGTDQRIYSTWWDASSGWAGWFNVSGGMAALGSPVTAVARNPNHLDLFVVGTDGLIYSTWWDAASGWAGWFNVSGGAAALGSRVEVVARNPNHLDLFVTGTDGLIYSTWWDAASGWAGWFNVSGGAADLGSPITAIARNPNHLDLFVTGTDGLIYSTWWDAATGWAGWFNVSGGAADLGAPITAIARNPNHLDLFVTGTDGLIYSTWWDAASGWAGWFNVSGGAAAPRSRINVVARNPNHLDLFVTGTDGLIYSTWWDAASGWAGWFNVSGGAAALASPIDVIARYPDHLDLFVTGTDRYIYSTWWDPRPSVFIRREIWGLESTTTFDPITLAYAKAVQVMQARPVSDPTSWRYQAGIHAAHAAPPPGAVWNACQHQGWFFLPWHRMYLYYFERIVRKAVLDAGGPADFALPYWNYDRPFPSNTLPPAFRATRLPDGSLNPLCIQAPGRSAALMAGGAVPSTATSSTAALANTTFSAGTFVPSFGGGRVGPAHFGGALGLLETTPHNVMHPTIGGPMSGACAGGLMTDPACAALDPIFWLHHANIDRLWNNWLALGGGRANPTDAAWLTQTFTFVDETGATVSLSGAAVVDSAAQLGYVYDDVPAPPTPVQPTTAARPAAQPPELTAATEAPLTLVGATVGTSLTMPTSARQPFQAAAASPDRQVFVTLDSIEAQRDPGLAYAVFIGDATGAREHIGNLTLFGITEMNDPDRPHDGAPGFRHTLDATLAVRRLAAAGAIDPDALTVSFEPIRVEAPPGVDLPPDAVAPTAVAPVRVGRVGVFVS